MERVDYFTLIQEGLKKLSPDLIEKYVEVESEYRTSKKMNDFMNKKAIEK